MSTPGSGERELGIAGITDATEIGAGGFGIVYRAVEADLGRTVAVKVLSGNLDEGARHRFERERRAMGRLSGHPNIVTIYRGGYTDAGNAYLVMEYLDRGSLADRLATAGPLGWEEAVKFAVQLSGALETSHRAGVLHRDIKPGNILLSSLGNAKLCDFGIARLQGAPETRSSVVTASLAHAPPDIVSGARPDARSDVYSLASTMFELVAGAPPFVRPTDESMVPILARIATDPVPALPGGQLPPAVFEVVEHAMAKDPGDRPATASQFGQMLVGAQQRLGLPATPIPIETVAPETDASPGYIPFPETDSGPLPAPNASSPATGPLTGGQSGSTAPPTVVTGADAAVSGGVDPAPAPGPAPDATRTDRPTPAAARTQVSDQHDPQSWAPPATPERAGAEAAPAGWDRSRPSSPDEALAQPATGGRPAWLLPVLGLAAVLLVVGGVLGGLTLVGDDGDDDETTTETIDDENADPSDDDDDDSDDSPPTSEGQGDDDYPVYEVISDETGSITLAIPEEWDDRLTGVGTDNLPQITASPFLDDYFDLYEEPGLSIAVTATTASVDFDRFLDLVTDDKCTPNGRNDVTTPYVGRMEQFVDCDGGSTRLVHVVFVDGTNNLTAVLRIQILADRDLVAANTIRQSLRLEDNLPE